MSSLSEKNVVLEQMGCPCCDKNRKSTYYSPSQIAGIVLGVVAAVIALLAVVKYASRYYNKEDLFPLYNESATSAAESAFTGADTGLQVE